MGNLPVGENWEDTMDPLFWDIKLDVKVLTFSEAEWCWLGMRGYGDVTRTPVVPRQKVILPKTCLQSHEAPWAIIHWYIGTFNKSVLLVSYTGETSTSNQCFIISRLRQGFVLYPLQQKLHGLNRKPKGRGSFPHISSNKALWLAAAITADAFMLCRKVWVFTPDHVDNHPKLSILFSPPLSWNHSLLPSWCVGFFFSLIYFVFFQSFKKKKTSIYLVGV